MARAAKLECQGDAVQLAAQTRATPPGIAGRQAEMSVRPGSALREPADRRAVLQERFGGRVGHRGSDVKSLKSFLSAAGFPQAERRFSAGPRQRENAPDALAGDSQRVGGWSPRMRRPGLSVEQRGGGPGAIFDQCSQLSDQEQERFGL